MKILLYNPNTTEGMTNTMTPAARHVAHSNTLIVGETAARGPSSIEGYYDEALSIPPLLERLKTVQQEGFDGVIIGCFDDTGLDAARSLLHIPVIGLCQSAAHIASVVCERFAIVTTMPQSVSPLRRLLKSYIGTERCSGVFASSIPVLDLEEASDDTIRKLVRTCRDALVDADGLVLGCAGMAPLAAYLSRELGVPVIEPVTSAVKMAEAIVGLDLKTSKLSGWTAPRDKERTP